MKIALTADAHLTTLEKNPERFQALGNIFKECGQQGIQLLIIAGDLFDQSQTNYAEFEALYREARPENLSTIIIPGNHDPDLTKAALAGDGLQVYAEPQLKPLNDSRQILFLPYQERQSMGEAIAPFADSLQDTRWILIGHGDWTGGNKTPDPYEAGVYMPLTRPDLKRYQPELAFLGHIHLPQDDGKVFYPGSPCPLNITETGTRRFLILDTSTGKVTSQQVDTPLLYYQESFLIMPGSDQLAQLEKDIQERVQSWGLPRGWEDRVQVRLELYGSSSADRDDLLETLQAGFDNFRLYQDQPPSLENLLFSLDEDRTEIASQLRDWAAGLDWPESPDLPDKDQILQEALKIIYQAKP